MKEPSSPHCSNVRRTILSGSVPTKHCRAYWKRARFLSGQEIGRSWLRLGLLWQKCAGLEPNFSRHLTSIRQRKFFKINCAILNWDGVFNMAEVSRSRHYAKTTKP